MTPLKPRSRILRKSMGILLVLLGVYLGYWWFYKLAPLRHTLDREWRFNHSQQEYWAEVETQIRRGLWGHDEGFMVGWYGDKPWAEWIMARLKPGDTMGCINARLCHSSIAMEYMTNRDLGERAEPWIFWWGNNRAKTQEEWIADGFRQQGYEVSVPPNADQIPVLLAILGRSEGHSSNPDHLSYNGFRCLRDSGFGPVAFLLANPEVSPEAKRGLLRYEDLLRRWPSANNLGILPFAKQTYTDLGMPKARILDPRMQIFAVSIIFGLILLGAALLRGNAWKKTSFSPPCQ